MKKFEANDKGIQLFKSYGQRYYLLYEGKVPDLFAPTVRASLAAIKSKNTKNRMSTFYFIVDADEQIQGSVMAISGVARPETSSSLLGSKLKNAQPTMEFVPCLPNNVKLGEAQLDESVEDDNNRMDKIDLFIRFLIQLTSNLDKGEYQNLAQKFHLTDADTLNIRKMKALFGSEAFKQLFRETCEKNKKTFADPQEETSEKMSFLSYILGLDAIHLTDPGISERMRQFYVMAGFFNTYEPERKQLQERLTTGEFLSDSGTDLAVFKDANLALWNLFEQHKNFDLSAVLSHCAETNLLAFLKQNKTRVENQGKHFIFSIKVSHDEELTVSSPCDVCLVHLPLTIETLLSPEVAAQAESFGSIPCQRVSLSKPESETSSTEIVEEFTHTCSFQ